MNKIFATILALSALLSSAITAQAREEIPGHKKNLWAVGIENTRLLYGRYVYDNHVTAKLNVSVYSEKIGFQYARATVGYQTQVKFLDIFGEGFFGSAFNGSYVNAGANIGVAATLVKRLLLDAQLTPWYDSGWGYNTCFQARIGCKITKQIDIKVGYSTIPEYRMSEKRIIGGFDFHVNHLYVSPYLSVNTGSHAEGKDIRVVFGFGYIF